MISPVPPILVVEGLDDVYVYETVEEAALSLEPWWVAEDLGSAYDAEGRLLRLGVDKFNVVITLDEQVPGHVSELKSILISHLNAVGQRIDEQAGSDLASLVRIAAERAGIVMS